MNAEQKAEALRLTAIVDNGLVNRLEYWQAVQGLTDLVRTLAAEPQSEPVAWTTMPDADDWLFLGDSKDPNGSLPGKWKPLYLHPAPARTPLTDEQLDAIYLDVVGPKGGHLSRTFARAIERSHGIVEKP